MHHCYRCGSACYCHYDMDDPEVEAAEYTYELCEGCGCTFDPDDEDYQCPECGEMHCDCWADG